MRDLQAKLHVPFGLIESDWGGTPAEAWMEDGFLRANPDYEIGLIKQWALDQGSALTNGALRSLREGKAGGQREQYRIQKDRSAPAVEAVRTLQRDDRALGAVRHARRFVVSRRK